MSVAPNSTVVPFAILGSGSGVTQSIQAGAHQFSTDTYPAFGGKDEAPSPLFYALGALSSCSQITASLVAKDLGITLGEWTFEVVGDLDTSVLVGGADGNANFEKVAVRATVETDADEAAFERLVAETERRCPVAQLFKRSGLDFDNVWSNAALPVLQTA